MVGGVDFADDGGEVDALAWRDGGGVVGCIIEVLGRGELKVGVLALELLRCGPVEVQAGASAGRVRDGTAGFAGGGAAEGWALGSRPACVADRGGYGSVTAARVVGGRPGFFDGCWLRGAGLVARVLTEHFEAGGVILCVIALGGSGASDGSHFQLRYFAAATGVPWC